MADDLFVEDESQIESDSDIGNVDESSFSSAVVSGNDWTVETLVNQIDKGNIQLNPDFQRRDAWDRKRKSKFIESLILGLPIPQVVLAESKKQRGSYIVLDGKQRLLSIRQFAAKEDDTNYEQLKLFGLQIRDNLVGKTYRDLQNDMSLFEDLTAFENQAIRTVVIKNWPNEDFLYHVFLRLNTGSVPLSPQELRQALHPGSFVSFLDTASSNSAALKEILKLKKPDFRMRDAELLLRYFAFRNNLHDYSGVLKGFLDDTCKQLNSTWDDKQRQIENQLEEFENAHAALKGIFGANLYRKWNGQSYESRFNRAIFDIMILSFCRSEVRIGATGKEREIRELFKNLSTNNQQFLTSLETTTKSLHSTYTRLSTWFNGLNEIVDSNLPRLQLVENRIVR